MPITRRSSIERYRPREHRLRRRSSTIDESKRGLAEGVGVDHKPGEGSGGVLWDIELGNFQTVNRNDVPVRLIAGRWARTAISRNPVIRADLQCPGGELGSIGCSNAS